MHACMPSCGQARAQRKKVNFKIMTGADATSDNGDYLVDWHSSFKSSGCILQTYCWCPEKVALSGFLSNILLYLLAAAGEGIVCMPRNIALRILLRRERGDCLHHVGPLLLNGLGGFLTTSHTLKNSRKSCEAVYFKMMVYVT